MRRIIARSVVFAISAVLFAVAAVQIWLGYALGGRTGHQKRIFLNEEPLKFWMIVGLNLALAIVVFVWGLAMSRGQKEKK